MVYMVSSRVLKCSLHCAKCGFYRAANAIFGKVGRVASSGVDPGEGEGAIAPSIKIYLGESIFSPPQSFSWTAKNCTKNAPRIAILRSKIKKNSEKVVAPPKYIWIDAAGSVWRNNYLAINQKQLFANSVILFRSLPVNQKRSKLTGLCKKTGFMKLFYTCDTNIAKFCQSLFSFDLPIALSSRNVPKSLHAVSDIVCVEMQTSILVNTVVYFA